MAIFDLIDADIVQRLKRMRQHYCCGTCQRYESVEQLKSSVMARDETKSVINAAIREIKMLRKSFEAISRNYDEMLRFMVNEADCRCFDEYGQPFAYVCERCRILGADPRGKR